MEKIHFHPKCSAYQSHRHSQGIEYRRYVTTEIPGKEFYRLLELSQRNRHSELEQNPGRFVMRSPSPEEIELLHFESIFCERCCNLFYKDVEDLKKDFLYSSSRCRRPRIYLEIHIHKGGDEESKIIELK